MRFTKMHGCGNDYVLLDDRDRRSEDWSARARALCDRHFGVGSDGLLLVQPSSVADYRMRMFNPDGSESEMCGNGIRCFGKYLFDNGLVGRDLKVETGNGVLALRVHGSNGTAERLTVSMGIPVWQPDRIPVASPTNDVDVDGIAAACVSMGNPHAVHFIESPVAEYALHQVGPKVEHHPLFPRRVNFEIVRPLSRDRLEARVWERGAGETLACGTGACAIAAVAQRAGRVGRNVTIALPGGDLEIEWDGVGEVLMNGPATKVFEGTWLKA